MVDEVPLRKAVDTAWTVYLATHRDVDVADGRQSETKVVTCSGLAYLDRLPKDE
jgi:hypothetical protein